MAYVTPSFGGFTATIAAVVADTDSTAGPLEDGIDATVLTLDYNNGPLSVGFGVTSLEGSVDESEWGLGVSYSFGNFSIIGEYQESDLPAVGNYAGPGEAWALAGTATFGNNDLMIQYGESEDSSGTDTAEVFAIGLTHNLSKRTAAYVEYSTEDISDTDTFVIGLVHSF